jgi:hypothetical protein
MTSPRRITGVWITAFEETSFLAGESRSPDPNDIRRYEDSIELDPAKAIRMAGRPPSDANGESYLLNFVGRRTRDPVHVDCLGIASFGFVVDRLLSAKYLGPMSPLDLEALKTQPHPATVAHRHGGVWGRLEAAAVKSCAPHGRG